MAVGELQSQLHRLIAQVDASFAWQGESLLMMQMYECVCESVCRFVVN